jgi:WD40 repeat protein
MEALYMKSGSSPIKAVDAGGTHLAYGAGRQVFVRSLRPWDSVPRLVGTHAGEVIGVAFHPDGRQVAASDRSGQIRLWSTAGSPGPQRVLSAAGVMAVSFSRAGRWLGAFSDKDGFVVRLWDLQAPAWTEPLLLRSEAGGLHGFAFDPEERWLATAPPAALWPLGESYPRSLKKHSDWVYSIGFSVDGSTLLSASGDQTLRSWPMSPNHPEDGRVLLNTHLQMPRLSVDPRGERVAVSGARGRVLLVSLAGGPTRELRGFSEQAVVVPVAFSPDGRHLAAASVASAAAEKVVRVWDLEKGGVSVLGPFPGAGEGEEGAIWWLAFVDDNRLLACSPNSGILLLDRRDGSRKQLSSRPGGAVAVGRRHGTVVAIIGEPPELVRLDLEGRATRLGAVPQVPGDDSLSLDHSSVALDPTETMVATGGRDGIVRIAPVSGGEPHLFFGHTSPVFSVAFSPDGRWLASGGDDNTVRLWPVPDITKPPFHKRSHEEVLATLRSWTNLRVVPDAQAATGWKLEPGPFPGWQRLPAW